MVSVIQNNTYCDGLIQEDQDTWDNVYAILTEAKKSGKLRKGF